jgi:hypothetical protein
VATETKSPRKSPRPAKPVLDAEASASWRDQLLSEMANLASADEMIAWAHHSLGLKNTLTVPDARLVEGAFAKKIKDFDDIQNGPDNPSAALRTEIGDGPPGQSEPGASRPVGGVDHETDGSSNGRLNIQSAAAGTTDASRNTSESAQNSSSDARCARPVTQRTRRVRNKALISSPRCRVWYVVGSPAIPTTSVSCNRAP